MRNTEEYLDWFSLENLDSIEVNFNDINEKEWFNTNENIDEDFSYTKNSASTSIIWNLSIYFKSITLKNPATLVFKSPNWYKIIKGPNDIQTSKYPKTNPPIPCRRSTTLFNTSEVEISSKFTCTWKEIFDRLNSEPLKIEAYKTNPFGDQEFHSEGYINLKHILIQPERTNPKICNSYIYGANTYRIWPTRVLLYPVNNSNNNESLSEEYNKHISIENDQNNEEKNYMNNSNNNEQNTPLGLLEIDVIIQDCQKQSLSDNSPVINQKNKGYKQENSILSSKSNLKMMNLPIKHGISNFKNKLRNSISEKKIISPKNLIKKNDDDDDDNLEYKSYISSPENSLINSFENDHNDLRSNFQYFDQINEKKYKFDYFNIGNENIPKRLIEIVMEEIDSNEDDEEINELRKTEQYKIALNIEIWKRIEKERFIKHIRQLEEEFRKITLIRQKTIMKEFISDINRKDEKLLKLENLISNKILKIKNKENLIDNFNNENNRRIQILQFEHKKLLESQKNEYLAKLELERKKIQMIELEKNKWIKKYNDEEEVNNKLIKEIKQIKTNKKSDDYYKNEILRKDEMIQSYQAQIDQLKESIQLLKASRDHIKTQFDYLAASINFQPRQQDILNSEDKIEHVYNHDVNALLNSGLYNDSDKFIQHLKSTT